MYRFKKIFVILILGMLFLLINPMGITSYYSNNSYDYYVKNTFDEVGSNNFVTGIYLDYRLFDSIFEASILFISVSGVLFMGKKDESSL